MTNPDLKRAVEAQNPTLTFAHPVVPDRSVFENVSVLHYHCPHMPLRKALVSMCKMKGLPIVSPDETRTDIVEATTLFPFFWVSESEAGFARSEATCGRSIRGAAKKKSNTDEVISRINDWLPNIRVSTPDVDFTLYNNGNVRVGNAFVSDAQFDEIVVLRKKLSGLPHVYASRKKQDSNESQAATT